MKKMPITARMPTTVYFTLGFVQQMIRSSILLLVANGPSQLHKMYQSRCTAKNSWWWAERLPETCIVVIPIKVDFSASVDFIHKVPECNRQGEWTNIFSGSLSARLAYETVSLLKRRVKPTIWQDFLQWCIALKKDTGTNGLQELSPALIHTRANYQSSSCHMAHSW